MTIKELEKLAKDLRASGAKDSDLVGVYVKVTGIPLSEIKILQKHDMGITAEDFDIVLVGEN